MRAEATVSTADLGAALTYLEGLSHLARRLAKSSGLGEVLVDELARGLQDLDTDDPACFEPLRYESAAHGTGWDAVAENIDDLRSRLLEGYAEAAL